MQKSSTRIRLQTVPDDRGTICTSVSCVFYGAGSERNTSGFETRGQEVKPSFLKAKVSSMDLRTGLYPPIES